jgi:hypothetical protein
MHTGCRFRWDRREGKSVLSSISVVVAAPNRRMGELPYKRACPLRVNNSLMESQVVPKPLLSENCSG